MNAPRWPRALAVAALVTSLLVTACTAESSGSCPAPNLALATQEDATPTPGQSIRITGENFREGCSDTGGDPDVGPSSDEAPQKDIAVTLERDGAIVTEFLVDAERDGTLTAQLNIPSDASGTYEIKASTANALQITVE